MPMVVVMVATNLASQLPVLLKVLEAHFSLTKVALHLPALVDFQIFRATYKFFDE